MTWAVYRIKGILYWTQKKESILNVNDVQLPGIQEQFQSILDHSET